MGFLDFLCSHVTAVAIELVGCGLVWGLLVLMGLARAEADLILVLMVFFLTLALVVEWLLSREFFTLLRDIAASGKDSLFLASELREPSRRVERLAWRAMSAVVAEAHRRIGEMRVREDDYRDYVETWVHEIKTPLAAMDLMLDNLSGVNTYPLRHELDQVGAYVEQSLYYARSSAVEKDFVVRPCDLAEEVREAVRSRASELIGTGVAVDLSGLDKTECRVLADGKWVAFILGQLIDNAVHYRREDAGCVPRIEFGARPVAGEGGRVLLDVRDNGCGIPAADIGRVFEKGFTGTNGRMHKKSTGLGLYLVKTMCDRMGLDVAVTSLPGSWTCFTLGFPSAEECEAQGEVGPVE